MKKCLLLSLLFLAILCSCDKNNDGDTCAVNYTIDSTVQINILHKWAFVGFLDTATQAMQSPLCGNVLSDIVFTDSVLQTHTAPYYSYVYWYHGTALINYYSGSYNRPDSISLLLSQSIKTSITGTEEADAFERQFHGMLVQVTRFSINHNELTLYPANGATVMRFKVND